MFPESKKRNYYPNKQILQEKATFQVASQVHSSLSIYLQQSQKAEAYHHPHSLIHSPESEILSRVLHSWWHSPSPQAFSLISKVELILLAFLPHWLLSLSSAGPSFLREHQPQSLGELTQFHDFKYHKLTKPLIFTSTSHLPLSNRLIYPAAQLLPLHSQFLISIRNIIC